MIIGPILTMAGFIWLAGCIGMGEPAWAGICVGMIIAGELAQIRDKLEG